MQISSNPSQHSHSYKIFIVSILILLFTKQISCQFDISRFRIVDKNQDNFLIRGNLPLTNNTFQFQHLYQSLAKFTGIDNYRLVIYSLLNLFTAKQTKSKYIQQNQFDQQGIHIYKKLQHYYYSNPIIGSYYSPSSYPPFLRKYALKYYKLLTYDSIPQLMDKLQRHMNSPIKTIVYFHCSQGIDRAGYVAAAYKMKNMEYTFTDAMLENFQLTRTIRGHMHFNSFYGLQWYCLYLGRTQKECLIHLEKANYIKTMEKYTNKTIGSYPQSQKQTNNKNKQNQL